MSQIWCAFHRIIDKSVLDANQPVLHPLANTTLKLSSLSSSSIVPACHTIYILLVDVDTSALNGLISPSIAVTLPKLAPLSVLLTQDIFPSSSSSLLHMHKDFHYLMLFVPSEPLLPIFFGLSKLTPLSVPLINAIYSNTLNKKHSCSVIFRDNII